MRTLRPPFRALLPLGALLLSSFAVFACHKKFESGLPIVELTVRGSAVRAEVAATAESRATGLMFRREMGRDEGMLFVFPQEEPLSFWMKNTHLPLSIAFLDAKGVILNIEDMEPRTETPHRSKGPARYALEMNQGWFKKRGAGPGDIVGGLPIVP